MTSNISLSPHFCLDEFTKSATARSHGIKNEPAPEHVENLKALCQGCLEPLREALGLPVVITSGYRTKALNSMLAHSSERSQHMLGQAADFYVAPGQSGQSRRELLIRAFRQIITDDAIAFDQCIIYPSFIHVSYVRSGRKNRSKLTKAFANGSFAALTRAQALSLE